MINNPWYDKYDNLDVTQPYVNWKWEHDKNENGDSMSSNPCPDKHDDFDITKPYVIWKYYNLVEAAKHGKDISIEGIDYVPRILDGDGKPIHIGDEVVFQSLGIYYGTVQEIVITGHGVHVRMKFPNGTYTYVNPENIHHTYPSVENALDLIFKGSEIESKDDETDNVHTSSHQSWLNIVLTLKEHLNNQKPISDNPSLKNDNQNPISDDTSFKCGINDSNESNYVNMPKKSWKNIGKLSPLSDDTSMKCGINDNNVRHFTTKPRDCQSNNNESDYINKPKKSWETIGKNLKEYYIGKLTPLTDVTSINDDI